MNNALKGQIGFLHVMQQMREEMDRVWKDFFQKNPNEKEEEVRKWVEERFRKLTKLEGSAQESLIDHRQVNLSNNQ